jgi:hypothetical protein
MSIKGDSDRTRYDDMPAKIRSIIYEVINAEKITNFSMIAQDAGEWWGRQGRKKRCHQKHWLGRTKWNEVNIGMISIAGLHMETADALLRAINEEVGESSKILKATFNEVNATYELLEPKLAEMIHKVRASRMTVTTELKQSLNIMKDVRKFFLESDFKIEMERLERFVELGERLKAMIDDGTMDAITDIVLKLAIGGEENETKREGV